MDPILIGYLPKLTKQRPDWLGSLAIEEVCSVSGCISAPPDGYLADWAHNGLCLFDTVEKARAAIAMEDAHRVYEVYAYKLTLTTYGPAGEREIAFEDLPQLAGPPPACTPLTADFERLGYDCIQTEWSRAIAGFGCSPLSCNYRASQIDVNRYCLIEELDRARAIARQFAVEQPEPGDYYVVEVWRMRRSAPST